MKMFSRTNAVSDPWGTQLITCPHPLKSLFVSPLFLASRQILWSWKNAHTSSNPMEMQCFWAAFDMETCQRFSFFLSSLIKLFPQMTTARWLCAAIKSRNQLAVCDWNRMVFLDQENILAACVTLPKSAALGHCKWQQVERPESAQDIPRASSQHKGDVVAPEEQRAWDNKKTKTGGRMREMRKGTRARGRDICPG